MKLLVGNIQKFCLHDGPGIRTVVFMKGCSIHCPWCANPENQSQEIQLSKDGLQTFGYWIEESDLIDECLKDQMFFGHNGGVTFSGGEPLIWANELQHVLKRLKQEKISICLESSLFGSATSLQLFMHYVDLIYIDVKVLIPELCESELGGNLQVFFSNLQYVESLGKQIIYRVPLVPYYTLTDSNLVQLEKFFTQKGGAEVEIFLAHHFAHNKYLQLGLQPPQKIPVLESERERVATRLRNTGVKVKELSI